MMVMVMVMVVIVVMVVMVMVWIVGEGEGFLSPRSLGSRIAFDTSGRSRPLSIYTIPVCAVYQIHPSSSEINTYSGHDEENQNLVYSSPKRYGINLSMLRNENCTQRVPRTVVDCQFINACWYWYSLIAGLCFLI